jgi:hypothetical protein
MVSGLLMELDDHNYWTIAEAVGHRGPHRLQAFVGAQNELICQTSADECHEAIGRPERLLSEAVPAFPGPR